MPVTLVFLFTPGPVRWKLWTFDKSLTVIEYFPDLIFVTFVPLFLSVIVKPGTDGADELGQGRLRRDGDQQADDRGGECDADEAHGAPP